MKLQELRELLAQKSNEAQELYDKANTRSNGSGFTAEEAAEVDRRLDEIENVKREIARAEAVEKLSSTRYTPEVNENPAVAEAKRSKIDSDEYRSAFESYLKGGTQNLTPDESRVLTVGVNADGGFFAPDTFVNKLITSLDNLNVMRQISTTLRTETGNDLILPRVAGHANVGWTAELAAFPVSQPGFETISIGAHANSVETFVSHLLAQDAQIDILDYVATDQARGRNELEEASFVSGNGVNKPRGVLLDAVSAFTSSSASAVTGDELLRLVYALKSVYRRNARFLIGNSAMLALRTLKDTTGQYIYQPGMQSGEPGGLLGYPVTIADDMPNAGVNNKSVAFGDFSYYTIRDAGTPSFQVLREKYADTGQLAVISWHRTDGRLTLPEAVQVITHPAA